MCLLDQVLTELVDSGITFALLREPPLEEEAGDIDILVESLRDTHSALVRLGYIKCWDTPTSAAYVRHEEETSTWTHLDVQWQLRLGDRILPREFTQALLRDARVSPRGIPRLAPHDDEILLALHLAVNKNTLDSKYGPISRPGATERLAVHRDRYECLPRPLEAYLHLFEASTKQGNGSATLANVRADFRLPKQSSTLKRLVGRVARTHHSWRPIVLLGPDGAGKTTLASALAGLRWPKTKYQFMGPSRQTEMRPIIWKVQHLSACIRARHSKTSVRGALARLLWHATCYADFLDRIGRHVRFAGDGGVVFYDRYACDMFIREPQRVKDLFFVRLFPRPRFAYLCVGDPVLIHQRKPELSVEAIKEATNRYREILKREAIPWLEVDTTKLSLTAAAHAVATHGYSTHWHTRRSARCER